MTELPTIEIDPEEMARIADEMYHNLGPPGPSDPGFTAKEYAEETGKSLSTAKHRLQRLVAEGLVIRGIRWGRRSDGRWNAYPAYRPKEEE